MKLRPSVVFVAASFVLLLAVHSSSAQEAATGAPVDTFQTSAGACSDLATIFPLRVAPIPAAGCGFCSGADFCPKQGVRCTYQGTCQGGSAHCCEYTCRCDETCTTVSQSAEACTYEVPYCCSPGTFCQVSYCGSEGIRCTYNGTCGPGGCCGYTCAPDATCILPDPLPPNAC